MVQLAAWLVLCGAAAWLTRRRIDHGVVVVILLWTLVPAVGGHHLIGISGRAIAFHPATWFVLCIFGVQLVLRPATMARALARHYLVILAVGVFAAGALATSVLSGSGGTRLLADQIVAPFLLWWLIVAGGSGDRRFLRVVRTAVLAAMAVQSVLALVQYYFGQILFYAGDYARLSWFNPERFDRWMGTSDSPLVLSLGVCVAGALAAGIRSSIWRFSLLGLYLLATVITQSRTGTAVLCLVIVYSIVRSRMALWARAVASVVVVVFGLYVAGSTVFAGLASRFANDTGSADARALAARFVYENINGFLFTGHGLTSSYGIARNAGLETSLENSYFMYVIDTGLLLATLYFGCQLAIVCSYGTQRAIRGVTLAAAVATLLQHTFSAVAFANYSGTLVWTALALVVVAWTLPPPNGTAGDRSLSGADHIAGDVVGGAELGQSSTGAPAAVRAATSAES